MRIRNYDELIDGIDTFEKQIEGHARNQGLRGLMALLETLEVAELDGEWRLYSVHNASKSRCEILAFESHQEASFFSDRCELKVQELKEEIANIVEDFEGEFSPSFGPQRSRIFKTNHFLTPIVKTEPHDLPIGCDEGWSC